MAVNYENLPGAGSAPRPADYPNVRDFPVAGPLDATLPPTPIRELLAASGATVFVLATDANFISTIRRAAEQHPLFVVETWPDLVEAVEAGRCGIALLNPPDSPVRAATPGGDYVTLDGERVRTLRLGPANAAVLRTACARIGAASED